VERGEEKMLCTGCSTNGLGLKGGRGGKEETCCGVERQRTLNKGKLLYHVKTKRRKGSAQPRLTALVGGSGKERTLRISKDDKIFIIGNTLKSTRKIFFFTKQGGKITSFLKVRRGRRRIYFLQTGLKEGQQ